MIKMFFDEPVNIREWEDFACNNNLIFNPYTAGQSTYVHKLNPSIKVTLKPNGYLPHDIGGYPRFDQVQLPTNVTHLVLSVRETIYFQAMMTTASRISQHFACYFTITGHIDYQSMLVQDCMQQRYTTEENPFKVQECYYHKRWRNMIAFPSSMTILND